MRGIRIALILALVAAFSLCIQTPVIAQFGGLKDKAKQKAEEKAKQKAEEEAQKATEQSDDSSDDSDEAPDASETQSQDESADKTSAPPKASGKPGEGVWVNYDFVPGDRVLFFDDFTGDIVGNFPQRLELLKGNMEVSEWKSRRWLRTTTYSDFLVPLPDVLPSRFTLEFDLYSPYDWNQLMITGTMPEDGDDANYSEVCFSPYGSRAGIRKAFSKEDVSVTQFPEKLVQDIVHCRVMADAKYMKVYVNELRVANFPNSNFLRSKSLTFAIAADPEYPFMMTDIRVAASDKKMYDALVSAGRVATQGIFFDSGSDRIRPESTPTLKEIGQMLADHPDLRLLIEGHTDSQGDDASNQELSDNRANSVRNYLISQNGIDAGRLEAKGFGETKPVSSNDTPEGRQNNRRVELVKL